jgi:multiple sugar transport system permease protein
VPASSSPAVVERPSPPGTRPSNLGGGRVGGGPRRQTWFATSQRVLGRDWPTAWLFALPTVALLFGLIGYPVGRAVYLSFFNVVGLHQGAFVGLQIYQYIWSDDSFLRSLAITATFTAASEACKLVLGMATALMLHNLPRWGAVLGGLILVPYVIPEVVRALAWRILLDPLFGAANYVLVDVLHVLSTRPAWLGDQQTALPSVIGVSVWAGLPFFVILLTAGLKAIDRELYDAAAIDGAGAWRRFLHVTLPGLSHITLVALLLSTIFTFNSFGLTYLLTGGGPAGSTRLYAILAYQYGVAGQRYSDGVAVALSTAPILLVLIVLLSRTLQPRGDADARSAARGPLALVEQPVARVARTVQALVWMLIEAVEWPADYVGRLALRVPLTASARRRLGYAILYALVGVVVFFEVVPLYFIVVTAFRTTLDIQRVQHMFWPDPWTLEHVDYVLNKLPFVRWYANTILVAVVSMLVSVSVASLGAYSLTRLRWRGSRALSAAVLLAYLVPGALLVLPLYAILLQLHLINSLAALMVVYPTALLPFAIWLMMGYYRSVPQELEDAALIDGCTRFGAYWRVVLPLVRPALLAVAMFSITQAWNEFLYAFTFLWSSQLETLPVGLAGLIVGDVQAWGELMAAALLTTIPVAAIYILGQRFMVAGLTAGSVKG